ncbi:hypothetical protein ACFSTD_04145 [Novosphingobium colocasiae]
MSGPPISSIRWSATRSRKAFVWIGTAALFALAVFLAQSLLVVFGGVVFAALIDGGRG